MKCFEKIVKNVILTKTKHVVDPFLFAYRAHRGVDDALMTLLHRIYQHLDKLKTYVRTLFIDFSSAFNTINPNILVDKLSGMDVNHYLILWIENFLADRSQQVRIENSLSDIL